MWIHEGVSLTEDDYELCTKLEHLPELSWLPKQGYLGVSAATGGLSDDHDVLSFVTHSITPLETKAQEVQEYTLYVLLLPYIGFECKVNQCF